MTASVAYTPPLNTVSGTVNEGQTLTLTAPVGKVFTGVDFASYGTPNNFEIGTCHAANSATLVGNIFIGNSTGTISATNGVFGDPCSGTGKRLSVILLYTASDTTAPIITGPSSSTGATSSITINENQTAINTFTANESITWSISESDYLFFSITSGGILTISSRNFEAPADIGANNTYVVAITATDAAGNTGKQTLTVTIADVNEVPVIAAPTISGTVHKGLNSTISVSLDKAGKIRFFASGKRIKGCLVQSTAGSSSSFSAVCNWKPAVSGIQRITALITPSDTNFSSATSAPLIVVVLSRTNSR